MGIIVCPEATNIPCLVKTKEDAEKSTEKFNKKLYEVASATAKRYNSMLFIKRSDNVQKAKKFLNMVIDTILTNGYNIISQILK